jgi:radical SAM protein with 4Fe4S-binding SPASM domain
MALFLQPDVELAADAGNLLLRRRGVPVAHVLGVGEAIALSWLAHTGDLDEAGEACAACLPQGGVWLSRVVDRYWTYLGDGPVRPLDLAWIERMARARPKFPVLIDSTVRQEAAPACLTWMVTLGCNRHCPYCFFDVFDFPAGASTSPPDATFSLADACRMVREMASIGAADLYLTGGEPFLRRDLPEIIEEASRVRVRAHAVTKLKMSRAFARRLADARIASVTVSLDDPRPRQAAALAGAPGYLDEARQTIAHLLEAGIDVDVNAVVTKVNAAHLDELAGQLVELGVGTLTISPFSSPFPRRAPAENLSIAIPLAARVSELGARFAPQGLRVELGSGGAAAAQPCGTSVVCEIGTRALDVMPDGSVSRCHYLPGVPQMIVGSLRTQSLIEIWTGDRLMAMSRPGREVFGDSACGTCHGHSACNARGRCYVSALQDAGTLHAPDAFCTQ